jgi:2-hydroxy-6-oxonona-2,4-dienedioate hydrolase
VPSSYRQDMQRAWSRIAAIPAGKLETRLGTVEYAERGAGLPVLVCHGVLGCHADGVDGWWTNILGEGFRVIAPARFGYFGSTLPENATPADQADAYALLLDHLGVGRAAVIGYSAGSASALEFARRHPASCCPCCRPARPPAASMWCRPASRCGSQIPSRTSSPPRTT